MRKLIGTALAALSLAVALAPADAATAKTRHRHHYRNDYAYVPLAHPPVVVERRSWLDPGTVVPAGSTTLYATQPAYSRGDPVGTNQRGWYMDESLHPTFGPNPRTGGFGGYYDGY
jgi:hypothetical protein